MKAFALVAVLLLAGSATAQLCTDVPELYCASCAASPNEQDCATCDPDDGATPPVAVVAVTLDVAAGTVVCVPIDACLSAIPGCVNGPDPNFPCDASDPRVCVACDAANGFRSAPEVDGACLCDDLAGFVFNADSTACVCAPGTVLFNGQCIAEDACSNPTSPDFVTGCTQCDILNDPRICVTCDTVPANSDNTCPSTDTCLDSVTGCASCQASPNQAQCAACNVASNFQLVPVANECLCAANRILEGSACVCDASNGWVDSSGTCTCSADGFELVDGTCRPISCPDPRCLPGQCSASPNVCEQCIDGFVPINGECVMDGCLVEHCTECVIDPSTGLPSMACEVCSRGYTASGYELGQCKPLPPNPSCTSKACLKCMPGKTNMCETCVKGYEPDYNFRCVPTRRPVVGHCQRRFPGCTRCDKAARRCLTCRKGLRLVKGRCVRPHRPNHKRCKKGMRLVKGRCVRVHRKPRKPVCKKGFRLVKGRCMRTKRY